MSSPRRLRDSLSASQARRVALAAQGFGRPRPPVPGLRQLRAMVHRLSVVQIDSVNVLSRAHYLPGWSRLGGYDPGDLDRLAYRRGDLFEYWAHEASLLPVEIEPLLRWRKAAALRHEGVWGSYSRVAREQPELLVETLGRIADEGPRAASDLSSANMPGARGFWQTTPVKRALEYLFWSGQLAVAERRRSFERVYDLPERVLPADVLDTPTPPEPEARRELLLLAARAHGVGTATDLADYFRQTVPAVRPLIDDLVAGGELLPVQVQGWSAPGYVLPDLVVPRRIDARALLAPFDPVVWERPRVKRLFDFDYRIEIYVPAERRRHGYYVLPFLLGEHLVARVDLKADRQQRLLRVRGASTERGAPPETAEALAAELQEMADWLGLADVVVESAAEPLEVALRAALQAELAG